MAQQCDICGKKPQSGNRISHAHNVTKRRWNVNLRPVHARVGATTSACEYARPAFAAASGQGVRQFTAKIAEPAKKTPIRILTKQFLGALCVLGGRSSTARQQLHIED